MTEFHGSSREAATGGLLSVDEIVAELDREFDAIEAGLDGPGRDIDAAIATLIEDLERVVRLAQSIVEGT